MHCPVLVLPMVVPREKETVVKKSKSQRSVGEENCAGRTGSSSLHFDFENVGFSGYKLGKIYAQLSHLYNPRLLVMNIT